MMWIQGAPSFLIIVFFLAISISAAASSASTFVYNTTRDSVVFAVIPVKNNGDVYLHMEGPADYGWLAFGTGDKMDGSRMWVIYRDSSGSGVTLSLREADGHSEPSFDAKVACQTVGSTTTNRIVSSGTQEKYTATVLCKNMNGTSNHGSIDISSSQQNFIFALGPTDKTVRTDSQSASIRRHALYGQFSMNLAAAAVEKSDDANLTNLEAVRLRQNQNAQLVGDVTTDHDWSGPAHAALMGGAFVIIFPLGVIFLRVMKRLKWHAWTQGVGLGLVTVGVGVGIYLGLEYNHSKNFRSAHQIIGIIAFLLCLFQFGIGAAHHRLFERYKRPTALGRTHRYIGPLILLLGAANGVVGFNFAGEDDDNIWYGPVWGVVFLTLAIVLFWSNRRDKRKENLESGGKHVQEPVQGFRDTWKGRDNVPLISFKRGAASNQEP